MAIIDFTPYERPGRRHAVEPEAKTYTLVDASRRAYPSPVRGQWGGHRRDRVYGTLDCRAAAWALQRGGYAAQRVFFADEATAVSAGYRPCAACLPERYAEWKSAPR